MLRFYQGIENDNSVIICGFFPLRNNYLAIPLMSIFLFPHFFAR